MQQTNEIVTGLIAGLTPEHREMSTPCDEWNVHDLINHMAGGTHMIAAGLLGEQPEGSPTDMPDFLTDGPAKGWADAHAHLESAATPENLTAKHQMPFGEVPGEQAVSIIAADVLIHSWDLAQATGQEFKASEELAEFAMATFKPLLPPEARGSGSFKEEVAVPGDASAVDRMIGFAGRQP